MKELISSNLSAGHVLSVYCEIGKINFIKFVSETLRYIVSIIEFENTFISFINNYYFLLLLSMPEVRWEEVIHAIR